VAKFIDERNFADIQRIGDSNDPLEREAAALVCSGSDYPSAKEWLSRHVELKAAIDNKTLSWSTVAAGRPVTG
jgi:hypothetical protein